MMYVLTTVSRNAYDALVNLYHPDVAGDDLAAAQKFSEILNAYNSAGRYLMLVVTVLFC